MTQMKTLAAVVIGCLLGGALSWFFGFVDSPVLAVLFTVLVTGGITAAVWGATKILEGAHEIG